METSTCPIARSVQPPDEAEGKCNCPGRTLIRVKGEPELVPSTRIEERTIIRTGKWLKVAAVQDEDLVEGESITDPVSFVRRLKRSGLKADVFTFFQRLPDTTPRYQFQMEWDNVAAIPISTYSEWWEKRTDPGVRRAVRRATKSDVVLKVADFDDAFVEGIVRINNETPVRQGKPFWHYEKSFDAVKLENSTYADRNVFLGAYWQNELIGYIRMTLVGTVGSIIQLLTMTKHFDKRPANALIAKAVEVCEQKKLSHLMYCNYVYNDPDSSLTEFKRRNGFEMVLLPRYYIPLTLKGRVALRLGIHRGIAKLLPKPLLIRLLKLRSQWYARQASAVDVAGVSEGTA